MNRRDFFRIAGWGLLGTLFPGVAKEGLDDMTIANVLAKIADNVQLSAGEKDELRRWASRTEMANAYVGGLQSGGVSPIVQHLQAQDIEVTNLMHAKNAGVRLWRSTAQTIADDTATTVQWDTEIWDDRGFANLSADNTLITIPAGYGGRYLIGFDLSFDAPTLGVGGIPRFVGSVFRNGVMIVASVVHTADNMYPNVSKAAVVVLSAGDELYVTAYQITNNSLDLYSSSERGEPSFWATKIQ